MLLMDAGIIDSSVGWLGYQTFAKIAVIIVDAWVRIPFAMIVFLAGLQSIPNHMYEAVEIDGGTVFTKFRHVTLPYLRPYFGLVILITWMFAFRAFAFVFTMTGGGPGQATRVLAIEIHNVGIRLGDYGYAAALSLFLVLITLILGAVYITVFLRGVDE
jgi:multiple sugar transport system permease protein